MPKRPATRPQAYALSKGPAQAAALQEVLRAQPPPPPATRLVVDPPSTLDTPQQPGAAVGAGPGGGGAAGAGAAADVEGARDAEPLPDDVPLSHEALQVRRGAAIWASTAVAGPGRPLPGLQLARARVVGSNAPAPRGGRMWPCDLRGRRPANLGCTSHAASTRPAFSSPCWPSLCPHPTPPHPRRASAARWGRCWSARSKSSRPPHTRPAAAGAARGCSDGQGRLGWRPTGLLAAILASCLTRSWRSCNKTDITRHESHRVQLPASCRGGAWGPIVPAIQAHLGGGVLQHGEGWGCQNESATLRSTWLRRRGRGQVQGWPAHTRKGLTQAGASTRRLRVPPGRGPGPGDVLCSGKSGEAWCVRAARQIEAGGLPPDRPTRASRRGLLARAVGGAVRSLCVCVVRAGHIACGGARRHVGGRPSEHPWRGARSAHIGTARRLRPPLMC